MATIYTKTITDGTEKTLILAPREALEYRFNFPSGWNELRIGFTGGVVDATLSNAMSSHPGPAIQTSANGYLINIDGTYYKDRILIDGQANNRFYYGIKTSNGLMPGTIGTRFAGMTHAKNVVNSFIGYYVNNGLNFSLTGTANIQRIGIIDEATENLEAFGPGYDDEFLSTVGGAVDSPNWTSYASRTYLRYLVTNRGLPGQLLTVQQHHQTVVNANFANGAISNSSITALRGGLAQAAITFQRTTTAIPFVGTIPDAFFFYMPFTSCRYRFSNIAVEKYA